MATAPYQLWMDVAPIESASRASSTVTVTTKTSHGLTTGAYVQLGGAVGTAGTSMTGVYQVSVTSGTTFTYSSAGSAGTGTIGSAWIAYDLFNPPINYASGAARQNAMIAEIGSLNLSSNGDGSGGETSIVVLQEATPAVGPWFKLIPDNTRFRLVKKDTGSAPASDESDVMMRGFLNTTVSRMNGSGQGTITDVSIADVNVVLDRVAIFGKKLQAVGAINYVKSGGTVQMSFGQDHGFVAGDVVRVSGFAGGDSAGGINGIQTISYVGSGDTLEFVSAGGNIPAANPFPNVPVNIRRVGSSRELFIVSASGSAWPNLSSGDSLYFTAGTAGGFSSAFLREFTSWSYGGDNVTALSGSAIQIRMLSPYTGTLPSSGTATATARLRAIGYVSPPDTGGQMVVGMPSGITESNAVKTLLQTVNNTKAQDAALQRIFNTAGTASISGGTAYSLGVPLQFQPANLRDGLDTIVEAFSGQDTKLRRYHIDNKGNLNYNLVDPLSVPTYATAPYVITTDSAAGTPNTSTGKASVAPYNLSVSYDHDTTKTAMFVATNQAAPTRSSVLTYTELYEPDSGDALYPVRENAPRFDRIVEFPTANTNVQMAIERAAKSYFLEGRLPMLSGQFTLRGAGTAAWNANGFVSGYAQTGTATYSLVDSWQPGQWVEVNSASLNLSGLYRVEQVDLSFEPGSYVAIVTVSFNRKNPNDLSRLIAAAAV